MNNALPLDLSALDELPNTTYWNRDARMEYFRGGSSYERLNLIRHLFVNEVPLYFLSVHQGSPGARWIRDPFNTLEECLAAVADLRMKGATINRVEFIPITELNKLHRTYDEEHNEVVHDYTNWVHHFGGMYEDAPCDIFDGLTREDKGKFLPDESRHLLISSENLFF